MDEEKEADEARRTDSTSDPLDRRAVSLRLLRALAILLGAAVLSYVRRARGRCRRASVPEGKRRWEA
ncbi:hypothetical protein [Streptomyces uncialis]|uniref:hypothetical protein n=1 Tax=Streptomyces uncialis TaxID=1048205 RepID=UPI0033C7F143